MNFILFYFKIRATKSGTKLLLMDLYGYGTFCPPLFIFFRYKNNNSNNFLFFFFDFKGCGQIEFLFSCFGWMFCKLNECCF